MYSAGHIYETLPDAVAIAPQSLADHPEWLLGGMLGRSAPMQRLFSQMRCTARHLRIATIEGESGTGKTLAAETLHDLGPAAAGPFVPCLAAQFFQQGPSVVSLTPLAADAREGTLLLSHVEELSLEQQARLIAFLQWIDHQQSRRTPEPAPRQVFFSTRAPLRKLAASPQFRADLCHRLTAIRFIMPPLRERRDDLALLADSFARRFSATHGKLVGGIGPQTLERLAAHNWPGNVRELQSVIHTAALDCEGQWIRPIDLPVLASAPESNPPDGSPVEDDANLDRAILRHIQRVLARVDGNKLRAAKMLGISRSTLYRLLDAGSVSHGAVRAGSLNSQT
ncbi:MAG TPA: sigma 54-interacting transcriptional regulator [Silvibacterium sp.]|nr:sigma 54-interacting transcriptional regulator [Silvibacterium sp.]